MPSVRGPERLVVAALLVLSGTASGAAIGLGGAVLVSGLPTQSLDVLILIVGLGVGLDLVGLLFGGPKPPASGRQVPQAWSRLLAPPVVAVLYGARLGVGPLTILSTWTWWSVTVAAALAGPVIAAATGACFGAVRLLTTVAASLVSGAADPGTDHADHAAWFGKLRSVQRPNWIAINGLGLAAVSMFLLVGCGAGASIDPDSAALPTAPPTSSSTESSTGSSTGSPTTTSISSSLGATAGIPGTETAGEAVASQELITPAELEDVVRTAKDKQLEPHEVATSDPASRSDPASDPHSLSQALMMGIAGFEPVDDPLADRFLDIVAASEIQPDPTEEIALLETRGYEGGWTRAFRSATNDVAVTSVYQFEDAAEAEFYLEDGLITIGGYGGKFFDIEGLPGVRGFVQYFAETAGGGTEDLVSLGAAFQTGPRWYLVYFVGSVQTVTPELLIPAVTAQHTSARSSGAVTAAAP